MQKTVDAAAVPAKCNCTNSQMFARHKIPGHTCLHNRNDDDEDADNISDEVDEEERQVSPECGVRGG